MSMNISRVYDEVNKEKGSQGSMDHEKGEYVDISGREIISNEKAGGNLPLQAYLYYADIQREYEKSNDLDGLYAAQREQMYADPNSNLSPSKLDSQRMLRIAKAYSVFFLITTDILGPSNAPYAVAQMGWVPGVILYVLLVSRLPLVVGCLMFAFAEWTQTIIRFVHSQI